MAAIAAVTIETAADGALVLQTANGVLTLKPDAALAQPIANGATVTVTIAATGNFTAIAVPTAAAAANMPAAGAKVDVQAATPSAASTALPMVGVVGPLIPDNQVIVQTPQASFAIPAAAAVPFGARIALEVSAPAGPVSVKQPEPIVVGAKVPAIVLASNSGIKIAGKPGAALAPGTPVMVRIKSVEVPRKGIAQVAQGIGAKKSAPAVPSVPTAATGKPDAARIKGVVTGQAAAGGMLVRTDLGLLRLETPATLAPGTVVEVAGLGPASRPDVALAPPSSATLAATAPAPAADVPGFLNQLGQAWPAMAEALAAVQTVDPALVRQVITPKVPAPNLQLTNTFLMLMAALRGGDIRGWFGDDAAKTMERAGQKNFLAKLVGDISELAKLADETPAGEWRAIPLPLFDGKELQQVWMFTQQQKSAEGDPEDGDGDPATRFVIELDLSEIGGMQLDGLVQEKRFDLILRSRQELPQNVRRDLSQIMGSSLGATGFEGSLVFEAGDFPVNPMEDVKRRAATAGLDHNKGGVNI